ncbi:BURP domain-containing protein 6 [Aegilops tauschii subsp. strangulata]|uniref:BURP domain-containing protein n=1 Tax=Aegilops tauschii subsp. strangulata TaxID=200361 RepID=A0A452XR11_AEGTS|nr:protein RAFTIN 1B [Aegilops tauschii subsp. strangulata]
MASSAVLLLILMVVAPTVHGHTHTPGGTPAARFWEAALPDSPMPESIVHLVQKGTDHSPLQQHHSAAMILPNACLGYSYRIICNSPAQQASSVEGLFFRESDMRVGRTMMVALPAFDPAPFLPRKAAERIPFSNLTDALDRFGIAPGSQEAARVGETLSTCREAPLAGEKKACATSLEGVVLSATRMLATSRPLAAAASALPNSGLPRRAYTVQAIKPLGGGGGGSVACHSRAYPYAVYECHMMEGSSEEAYVVSIRGSSGLPTVDMAAVCHFDTSNWIPAHPAFKILGTHPGGSPVCHFLPYADLMFGVKLANNA